MLMTKISDSKYQPHINKPVLSWFSGVSIVVVTALGGAAVGIAASSIGTITALPMVAGALAGTAVGTALALVVIKLIRLVKNKLLKPAKHQAQPVQNQPSSKIKSGLNVLIANLIALILFSSTTIGVFGNLTAIKYASSPQT